MVEVTFLQKLTADEGALRLMIPTLVAPKYIPGVAAGDRTGLGTSEPTDRVPDADRISPKIGHVKYGLTLDILFDLGRDVTIESPSHAIITIPERGMRRRVGLALQTVALDRDIVLVAEGAPGVAAGLVCDKVAGEEGTFALTLVPDLFEAKKQSHGRAVLFLIDVSGSMDGDSIEQAKRAMRLCLRHLSEGDLFDILPFSSTFSHLSLHLGSRKRAGELVSFTQSTLKEADAYVDELRANGGTEMLAPLLAATSLLSGVKRDRVIVLLTDGQVGNEAEILKEVSAAAAGARVYTFGIGTNVSDALLRGLAQRTRGAVEFIHPGERIDEKVTAQFARATAARVDEITVKWVGVDAGEVAPGAPPSLVDGEPWSVYGRYEAAGIGHAEIRGTLGGAAFYMEVPMELAAEANRPSLTSLWAGARVRDLEEVDASSLGRRAEAHKKRIIDLSVRHKIASKYTSFVVVEKRTGERRAQGQPETRAVPVNAPAGWAMFGTAPSLVDEALAAPRERSAGFSGAPGGRATNKTMARPSAAMPARPRAPMPASPASYGAPSGGPAGFGPPPPPPPAQGGFGPPPSPPSGFDPVDGAPKYKRSAAPYPSAAPGGFAPPPPAFAPPSSLAAPSPAPASRSIGSSPPPPPAMARAEEAKPKGGLFERAKKALGLSKARDGGEEQMMRRESMHVDRLAAAEGYAAPEMDDAPAPEPAPAPADAGPEDIGGLFARQLASGLWESGDGSDHGRLAATTAVLLRCAKEGIDTSHTVYGAQITKSVEALSALAETLAGKGEADEAVAKALLVMVAVSAGKRARARALAIATAAKSATVQAVAAHLSSQDAARKQLHQV